MHTKHGPPFNRVTRVAIRHRASRFAATGQRALGRYRPAPVAKAPQNTGCLSTFTVLPLPFRVVWESNTLCLARLFYGVALRAVGL